MTHLECNLPRPNFEGSRPKITEVKALAETLAKQYYRGKYGAATRGQEICGQIAVDQDWTDALQQLNVSVDHCWDGNHEIPSEILEQLSPQDKAGKIIVFQSQRFVVVEFDTRNAAGVRLHLEDGTIISTDTIMQTLLPGVTPRELSWIDSLSIVSAEKFDLEQQV
ncbi:MAG: hypothetical protein DCC75_07610 [Proteobacteria bacterium]|nr:MAG: hypothetical protein DCC75_07610 [Pseudomonadota bacterium]